MFIVFNQKLLAHLPNGQKGGGYTVRDATMNVIYHFAKRSEAIKACDRLNSIKNGMDRGLYRGIETN